jgi:hypothetical protein
MDLSRLKISLGRTTLHNSSFRWRLKLDTFKTAHSPWRLHCSKSVGDSTGDEVNQMDMKAILAKRFAPLNISTIDGYPHPVPQFYEWKDLLPIFYEGEDDNPFEHVHEFHALMQQLDIHYEDILMKMFMYSLEGDARQWYKTLPASSISSLKDFHDVFYSHCKIIYPTERLFENCCERYASYIQD